MNAMVYAAYPLALLAIRVEARRFAMPTNVRQRTDSASERSRVRGETCAEHDAIDSQKTRRRPLWQIDGESPGWCNPQRGISLAIVL